MDHLLIPSNPKHDRIEVPLRAYVAYSRPFQTFATRHGWDMSELVCRDLSNDQIAALKCLLQTWLFFGLLEEVFGSAYTASRDGWIRKGKDGCTVISTAPLRPLLMKLADVEVVEQRYAIACLATANMVINSLSLSNSPLVQSVDFLALATLCDAIAKSLGSKKSAYRASGSLDLGVSRYLRTRMLEDGWCRNDVHRLEHQLDLPSLYLASNLDRPEPQASHNACSIHICKASQVDESRYTTLHDTTVCNGGCKFVGPPQDELAAILQSGVVPLISYDAEKDPSSVNLVPASPGTGYVAISHVWSHGLGNPLDNSLPRCQLARISRMVSRFPKTSSNGNTLFWMDTICFPVHHPKAADLALIFMRKTYKDAEHVLVIDRYLTSTESKPLLRTECLLRILCSSWTRRLWTLQEGALARTLHFQFADEAIEMQNATLVMTAEMTFMTHDRSLEYLPICSMVSELWEVWRTGNLEEPRAVLNYLAGGLRWRATSVAADEALCLATMVGLDMEKITQVPVESRMSKFWSLVPVVSAQAIFWSGSRINEEGYRWAPSTFLGQPDAIFQDLDRKSHSEMSEGGSSTLSGRGLRLSCAGVLLNVWRSPLGQTTWIRIHGRGWFRLKRLQSNEIHPKTNAGDDGETSRTLVLLMKNGIAESFFSDDPENAVTCILASIYDVDEGADIIYANTEDTTFLLRADGLHRSQKVDELVERVAELGECSLRLSSASTSAPQPSSTLHPQSLSDSASVAESAQSTAASEAVERAFATEGSSVWLRELQLSENQELGAARIRARDEDGRLSVDMDGQHYIFDGVELSVDQEWCLD